MLKNFVWDFLGKVSGQVISFISSLILTRLLMPEEYGLMGMAMALIYIASSTIGTGFYSALVQKSEISPLQFATVFYINLLLGLTLFLSFFLIAPLVAHFYGQPSIIPIFRTLSILFITNAFALLPSSLIYRQMNFKKITQISIFSSILSGGIGIGMAFMGYGVWSLVVQFLTAGILSLILTQSHVRYVPILKFQFSAVRPLWIYGRNLFASGILDTIFSRIDVFLIGKIFNPATLGYYSRAQTVDSLVRQMSTSSITTVLFPHIAKNQGNILYVRTLFLKYLQIILLLSLCLGGILYLTAQDLFVFLFSSRWYISGRLYQYMALSVFVWPVSSLICTTISAIGDSGAFLRLEILKKLLFIPFFVLCIYNRDIDLFILLMAVYSYLALYLNVVFASRLIKIKKSIQLKIIWKYLLSVILVSIVISILSLQIDSIQSIFFRLFLKVALFLLLYVLIARRIKLRALDVITKYFLKFTKNIND